MNAIRRPIAGLAALATAVLLTVAPPLSQAEVVAKGVADYTVFLDPPTGFVFVKLPAGWKFVGQVERVDLARLPAGVVTALLVGRDDDDHRLADAASAPRAAAVPAR